MRALLAKRLRREARAQTVGRPWNTLSARPNLNSKRQVVGQRDQHAQGCGRAVYKALKRGYRS